MKLQLGKIEVIDKLEDFILIDTNSEEIVKQPSDQKFTNLQVKNGMISIDMIDPREERYWPFGLIVDAKYQQFSFNYFKQQWTIESLDNGIKRIQFELPMETYTNPLKIELDYYPTWIEDENLEINIK